MRRLALALGLAALTACSTPHQHVGDCDTCRRQVVILADQVTKRGEFAQLVAGAVNRASRRVDAIDLRLAQLAPVTSEVPR